MWSGWGVDSQLISRQISVAKDRSSKLSLDIMHDSTFSLGDSLLGSLRTEIGDLLDKCAGDKGESDPLPLTPV